MSSLMWYIFDFARKAWADAFGNFRKAGTFQGLPKSQ